VASILFFIKTLFFDRCAMKAS